MYQRIFYMTSVILLRGFQVGLGRTIPPCSGVWTIVACGTSNGDLSLCNPGGDGNYVREVSVAQLAPGASCQYAAIEKRSISSGEFGYYSYDIWTKGTCVGIFNVCTGVSGSCCDPNPTTTTATITTMPTTIHASLSPTTTSATITATPNTNSASLSQCQDVNSNGFNVDTAIIAGSTVGGCLCLATILTAVYFICQRVPCINSSIMPNSDTRNREEDTERSGCSGGESADG